MMTNPQYNRELISHSLFGDYTYINERAFEDFKRLNDIEGDCFYDNTGVYKTFFEKLLKKEIGVGVFAVQPNGKIIAYDYLAGNFTDWIHLMYETAYPNIK